MKIVFFGTSPFAARILDFLVQEKVPLVAIVTRPDRPQGRALRLQPSAVKQKAQELHLFLPIYTPEKASTPEFAEQLQTLQPDLFLVVAYGEIIKQNLLSLPKKGAINIHTSLLPKYRGAAPMERALLNGETETGVTLIEMVLKMDAGAILDQASCPVPHEMTKAELEEELYRLACRSLQKVLPQSERGALERREQNEQEVTFAPKIKPEELKIDWRRSAEAIHDQIRAFSPEPGAWASILIDGQPKRLKIFRSKVENGLTGHPGAVVSFTPTRCLVACSEGSLALLDVQLEGKKRMAVSAFLAGLRQTPMF